MIQRVAVILLSIFLSSGDLNAQKEIFVEGIVLDASTNKALDAVNIFDQEANRGTFSEPGGRFKIKIEKLPATLIFSFIGYENYILKLDKLKEEALEINLQPSILRLPDVEVIAKPKIEKLTKPQFTVKDFVIDRDKILLVKYGGIGTGNVLELRDLNGVTLHSMRVKVKGVVQKLHESCLGNIHLIGAQEIIEVDFSTGKIDLIAKYSRQKFERYLKPCVESSEEYVYNKTERLKGQLIHFDFISKKEKRIEGRVRVADELNLARMPEELGDYAAAEAHYSVQSSHPAAGVVRRPEHIDAWIGVFYQPVFSPLYNTGKEICLFNHTVGFLRFYTFNGKLKRQIPINYHQEKHWDKKILKDKKTEQFYTVYNDIDGKKFYEINLEDGTVNPAFKIDCAYVEKMVIYDNHLYYQDSGIIPGQANRILHKVKVR